MTYKISSDGAAAVAPDFYWIPFSKKAPPQGITLLLSNKAAGRMQQGMYTTKEKFFDHWAPCPKFPKED
jgi:hypothetical protein